MESGMKWGWKQRPFIAKALLLTAKTAWKSNSCEKTWRSRGKGVHHDPWAPAQRDRSDDWSCLISSFARLLHLDLSRPWCWTQLVQVSCLWDPFAIYFDPQDLKNLHSTYTTWLTKLKSANTLKTSEAKHNSRNRGINHIIKHVNPHKMTLKHS